ncbi:Uncharacterised protein [Mycobacterium tuberculosis]|nr:Uncharacterised protein [Mycobacterium tuberculosis]
MEHDNANTERRQVRYDNRADQIQRCHNRTQQNDQYEQNDADGHGDDQSEVVIGVVARVLENDGQSDDRHLGIGQCGIWLRPSSGRRDRVNLVHGSSAEWIQVGLYQIPY